jgi:hypothetical protein
MPSILRSVIKGHRFELELGQIEPDARRADEFIEGVEFTLARLPEAGIQTADGSPVWCILNNDALEVPPLIVYYAFDEDFVYLLSVRRTHPPIDE